LRGTLSDDRGGFNLRSDIYGRGAQADSGLDARSHRDCAPGRHRRRANLIVIEQAAACGVNIFFRAHGRVGIPVTIVSLIVLAVGIAV
jgi:hypothetical protein